MRNQRRLVIIVSAVTFFIILLILGAIYFNYQHSNKGVYESFRGISKNNMWATDSDYSRCDNTYDDSCVVYAYRLLRAGLEDELASVNASSDEITNNLNSANSLVEAGKYFDSESYVNKAVSLERTLYKNNKQAIDSISNIVLSKSGVSGATVSDLQLRGDWAVVWINSKDTDTAIALLHKEGGSWKLILGPGTSFEPDELSLSGAPDEVINIIENGVSKQKDELYN